MKHLIHYISAAPTARRAFLPRVGLVLLMLLAVPAASAQIDSLANKSLGVTVNKIHWNLRPMLGDGGLSSQFSWNTTERQEQSEPFFYPADRYLSNQLFQLWNFVNFSDEGYVNSEGERVERVWRRMGGDTDWLVEKRRYRPPMVTVDGVTVTPPYRWEYYPQQKYDYIAEFEDLHRVYANDYGGFRNRITLYASSNPNHEDYVVWKETRRFTGELALPEEIADAPEREKYLPDQTVKVWWSYVMGFGPTKGGEGESWGYYLYESQDDREHYFTRPSDLVTSRARQDLTVAYFWDSWTPQSRPYSIPDPDDPNAEPRSADDDSGDPNRINGGLTATMIPGFTILHADESTVDHVDDPAQPFAAPRGNINDNFFGQLNNFAQRDNWAGLDSRFPGPVSESRTPEKGSMRGLTVGPYELTVERDENDQLVHADSFTTVYAVGVGDVGYEIADSLGRRWFDGEISDAEKNVFIEWGRDSLFANLDRAYWAYANLDMSVPLPPPPPDLEVTAGPSKVDLAWSYPDDLYYVDPHSNTEDHAGWRIYRKRGGFWVNDPDDEFRGTQWEQIADVPTSQTSYVDEDIERGIPYYYAVTAYDDGSANTFGLHPGESLESSRYENMSRLPAIPFKPGLASTDEVRVVPNPASSAAGSFGFEDSNILFANLPFEATLSIYTEDGQLVKRIDHIGSADYRWDQRTDDNQYVASGVYILAIHDAAGPDGAGLPDQFTKFVIVR